MNDDFAVQATATDGMVYPPRVLLSIAGVATGLSLVLLLPSQNHLVGYVVALISASLGGVVVVIDQKNRANSNYISFSWFSPVLRSIRFLALFTASGNIAYLAVAAWHGKAIF